MKYCRWKIFIMWKEKGKKREQWIEVMKLKWNRHDELISQNVYVFNEINCYA